MNGEESIEVEADTFFAFNTLISETRDLFIRQMDASTTGLRGVLLTLDEMVTEYLPDIARHFVCIRLMIHRLARIAD